MFRKRRFLNTLIFGGNILFIIFSGKNDEYASAAISSRDGSKTNLEYLYLGKVINREAGIYKSRKRGLFTFDITTGEFGTPSEDLYSQYNVEDDLPHKITKCSVDFGDSFFLNAFLYKSGLINIIDKIKCNNYDTLHTLILFYTLSNLANYDLTFPHILT